MAGYDGGGGGGGESFGIIDRAETFAESDVTVSNDGTGIFSETVGLGEVTDEALSPGGLNSASGGVGLNLGVVINPNVDLLGVDATIDGGQFSGGTAYLEDTNGNTLDSVSASSGETVQLRASLSAGTDYRVFANDGDDTSVYTGYGFPATSTSLDVVSGYADGVDNSDWHRLSDVAGYYESSSGSATVEWPHPPDVFGWDTATFQASQDGETAEVYIEESTDGGSTWTEVAGPIARGDDIPVSSDAEMRFRVDLSRASTANNPRVESLYRRYTV